jgi:hypothetical protein
MEAKAMEEKQHLTSNGAQGTRADWATLVAHAVDDVSRILHSEAELFQINLASKLRSQIDYAAATFAMVAAFICAGICVLAAVILLLHQSFVRWQGFLWWQALTIGALLMLVVGIAIRRVAGRSSALNSKDA